MQAILLILLVAAVSLAAGLVFNWCLAAAVAVALAIVLGWYFADPGPVLGESATRVTFKQHLLGLMATVRDLLGLDKAWAGFVRLWNWCGQTFGALLLGLDAYVAATPEIKAAVLSSPHGLYILFALNFVAFFASRRAVGA